jgi:hypothetical protein
MSELTAKNKCLNLPVRCLTLFQKITHCTLICLLYCTNIHGQIRDSPFHSKHVVPTLVSLTNILGHGRSGHLRLHCKATFEITWLLRTSPLVLNSSTSQKQKSPCVPLVFRTSPSVLHAKLPIQQFLSRQIKSLSHLFSTTKPRDYR